MNEKKVIEKKERGLAEDREGRDGTEIEGEETKILTERYVRHRNVLFSLLFL